MYTAIREKKIKFSFIFAFFIYVGYVAQNFSFDTWWTVAYSDVTVQK